MRREHTAQELIRDVFLPTARQIDDFKDFFEVTISFDDRGMLGLKIRLGEFCLEQHGAKFHVDFGPLDETANQRNTRLESEFRQIAHLGSQDRAEVLSFCYSGIAEDVHQQRVRAHGRIELAPNTIRFGQGVISLTVDFLQPTSPLRPFENCAVAGRSAPEPRAGSSPSG